MAWHFIIFVAASIGAAAGAGLTYCMSRWKRIDNAELERNLAEVRAAKDGWQSNSENWKKAAVKAESERDELKAQIESLNRCEESLRNDLKEANVKLEKASYRFNAQVKLVEDRDDTITQQQSTIETLKETILIKGESIEDLEGKLDVIMTICRAEVPKSKDAWSTYVEKMTAEYGVPA